MFACSAKQYEQILGPRPTVEQKDVEKDLAIIRSQLGQAEWAWLSEHLHAAVHQPLGDLLCAGCQNEDCDEGNHQEDPSVNFTLLLDVSTQLRSELVFSSDPSIPN